MSISNLSVCSCSLLLLFCPFTFSTLPIPLNTSILLLVYLFSPLSFPPSDAFCKDGEVISAYCLHFSRVNTTSLVDERWTKRIPRYASPCSPRNSVSARIKAVWGFDFAVGGLGHFSLGFFSHGFFLLKKRCTPMKSIDRCCDMFAHF